MSAVMLVREFGLQDDLESLVAQINTAVWDDANEMGRYEVGALRAYLQRPDTLFIACYQSSGVDPVFAGMASARIQMKPYDRELWLYVDEVDVCADQRRKGAGRAMMNYLLEYAADHDCTELWLGTESDNSAAQALYESLEPDEVGEFIGYTYEVDSTGFS